MNLDRVSGFEFFQAIRLFQQLNPDAELVGWSKDPKREQLRFRSNIGMAFPASAVQSLEPRDDDRHEMVVNFMGVATPGAMSDNLPRWYAQQAREQIAAREAPTLRDFFDLFNHRLTALFFRAWVRNNLPFQYEVLDGRPSDAMLFSTLGLATKGLRGRMAVDDRALLFHSPTLARRPCTPAGLRQVLREYFELPFEIEQFVPGWFELDESSKLRLGQPKFQLGSNCNLGSTVRISQCKFRIRVGPLDWEDYCRLLPGQDIYRGVADLVRFAVGPELEFDMQLVLRAEQVPTMKLDAKGLETMRLGWSTWLGSRMTTEDADSAIVPVSTLEEER